MFHKNSTKRIFSSAALAAALLVTGAAGARTAAVSHSVVTRKPVTTPTFPQHCWEDPNDGKLHCFSAR